MLFCLFLHTVSMGTVSNGNKIRYVVICVGYNVGCMSTVNMSSQPWQQDNVVCMSTVCMSTVNMSSQPWQQDKLCGDLCCVQCGLHR